MSYEVKLSNGNVLRGLELSGNTFLTSEEVGAETFRGGLERVEITGPEPEEGGVDVRGEYSMMTLEGVFTIGAKRGFVLSAGGVDEAQRLRSDVDYLAMMMEVEL